MSISQTRTMAACLADAERTLAGPVCNTFTAWKVNQSRAGQVQSVEGSGAILAEYADSIAITCTHKDTFIVLETDAITRGQWLHSYQVKRKSKPRYVMVNHVQRAVHDLYAEHVLTVEVSAFVPVEVWSWKPGADVVGNDPTLVDGDRLSEVLI